MGLFGRRDDRKREDRKKRLLAELAELLRTPPERLEATAAWRKFPGSGDSLDVTELVMDLEEELGPPG